jgi:hypothetical protein
MAEKHILSLEIPTVSNCEVLCVKDTSQYTTKLEVDCSELLITMPGFTAPVLIKVDEKFDLCLNACVLALQKVDCGTKRTKLPDGVYVVRYSVSPNDKVYVEYNHLRITNLLTTYYQKLCDIDVKPCEPSSEREDLLREMNYIKTLIDAAVAEVEYCSNPNKGMELYNYAEKLLNKIIC